MFNLFLVNRFKPYRHANPYLYDELVSNFMVVGRYLPFFLNLNRTFCKQTEKILVRNCLTKRCLIWARTVCPMSHKKDAPIILVNLYSNLKEAILYHIVSEGTGETVHMRKLF